MNKLSAFFLLTPLIFKWYTLGFWAPINQFSAEKIESIFNRLPSAKKSVVQNLCGVEFLNFILIIDSIHRYLPLLANA